MILYSTFVFYYDNRKRNIRIYCYFIAEAVLVVGAASAAAAVVFLHLMNESKQKQLVFRFIVGIEICISLIGSSSIGPSITR